MRKESENEGLPLSATGDSGGAEDPAARDCARSIQHAVVDEGHRRRRAALARVDRALRDERDFGVDERCGEGLRRLEAGIYRFFERDGE